MPNQTHERGARAGRAGRTDKGPKATEQQLGVCVCVVLFDSEVLVMDEEEGRDEAHEMTGRGGKQRETRRGWVQKRGGHS